MASEWKYRVSNNVDGECRGQVFGSLCGSYRLIFFVTESHVANLGFAMLSQFHLSMLRSQMRFFIATVARTSFTECWQKINLTNQSRSLDTLNLGRSEMTKFVVIQALFLIHDKIARPGPVHPVVVACSHPLGPDDSLESQQDGGA